ncbi:MAG TPA: hypothetical protein VJB59_15405 [Bdellovibrionota bacterium]|nr:hypothetical protein [Bdellovibrionota bacterium]
MGNPLKRRNILQVMFGICWTSLFLAALLAADRILLGPSKPTGWVEAAFHSVPKEVGFSLSPVYLPSTLAWPPREVFYRLSRKGWWAPVRPASGGSPLLWIGSGEPPYPEALGKGLAGCLQSTPSARCPAGWIMLSTRFKDGSLVYLITRFDHIEAARILKGLGGGG